MSSVFHVGLDVHADSIVAYLLDQETGQFCEDRVPNDRTKLQRAVARWSKLGTLKVCYEASSVGFVIKRWMAEWGVDCQVVAPSLIPRAPGRRVKTDRNDARQLSKLYGSGLLTVVNAPSEEEEGVRGLVRYRGQITQDMTRTKNRVLKHLSRLGVRYTEGKRNWTHKHRQWLAKLTLAPTDSLVLASHLRTLAHLECEREAIDEEIEKIASTAAYAEKVAWLTCLKGIAQYSAMVLITEIGDIHRFPTAPQIMSYFGLVPSEHSTGLTRHTGPITKTGNRRARWILGQAAWNQRSIPGGSKMLRQHRRGQPTEVVAIARKAERRLHRQYWKIANRKNPKTAATAVARELAGFVWAILRVNPA